MGWYQRFFIENAGIFHGNTNLLVHTANANSYVCTSILECQKRVADHVVSETFLRPKSHLHLGNIDVTTRCDRLIYAPLEHQQNISRSHTDKSLVYKSASTSVLLNRLKQGCSWCAGYVGAVGGSWKVDLGDPQDPVILTLPSSIEGHNFKPQTHQEVVKTGFLLAVSKWRKPKTKRFGADINFFPSC